MRLLNDFQLCEGQLIHVQRTPLYKTSVDTPPGSKCKHKHYLCGTIKAAQTEGIALQKMV